MRGPCGFRRLSQCLEVRRPWKSSCRSRCQARAAAYNNRPTLTTLSRMHGIDQVRDTWIERQTTALTASSATHRPRARTPTTASYSFTMLRPAHNPCQSSTGWLRCMDTTNDVTLRGETAATGKTTATAARPTLPDWLGPIGSCCS